VADGAYSQTTAVSPRRSHALAQTALELIDNPKNIENVTTFGMGHNLNQYSPLNQINKLNVKRLVWATEGSLEGRGGGDSP
jgi:glucose dehydrogenase